MDPETRVLRPIGAHIAAKALYVGDRIDVRALGGRLAGAPLIKTVGDGWAVIFRYGALVLFDVDAAGEAELVASLEDRIAGRMEDPETEEVTLLVDSKREEGVSGEWVVLSEASSEKIQVVSEILARSVVLARYEVSMRELFGKVEPMAAELRTSGQFPRGQKQLVKYIGDALLTAHHTVGRVEILEKPELLWDRPDLERLYARLEDEYELSERQGALEAKLRVVSETTGTLVDLLQARRSLRVEWYIVILIVVEIGLTLYELFWH